MSLIGAHRPLGFLLAATLAMPAAALAQGTAPAAPAAPPAATAAPAPVAKAPTARHSRATQSPQARVEARIAELHKQLSITPEQQGQWDQFAQVMRDNARGFDQALQERAGKMGSLNAVETMQSYETLAELHAQDVQKLTTAFQPLYAALSDAQKKAADAAFRPQSHARR